MILIFANYFPSILSAKFLSNSKTEAGAVFTFVGLIEAIKYFFLISIVVVLNLYGSIRGGRYTSPQPCITE